MEKIKCTKCGIDKPITEFYKSNKYKSGIRQGCKFCCSLYRKEYHIKNKDRENVNSKQWRKTNIGKDRESKLKYSRSPSGIYGKIKNRARCREQIFNITMKSFLSWYNSISKTCVYCGRTHEKVVETTSKYAKGVNRLTIDRKDNDRGYVEGNLVLACNLCNMVKREFFSFEEMKDIGKIIRKKVVIEN